MTNTKRVKQHIIEKPEIKLSYPNDGEWILGIGPKDDDPYKDQSFGMVVTQNGATVVFYINGGWDHLDEINWRYPLPGEHFNVEF